MLCPNPRCACDNPDSAVHCCRCGRKLAVKKSRRARANGMGTAYKRGHTWTASIIVGWKYINDNIIPIKRTKGGFKTKRAALECCQTLKAAKARPASPTFAVLYTQWEAAHALKVEKSTLYCYRAARKYYEDIAYMKFDVIGLDDLQECVDACPRGKRTKENMKALGTLLYKHALPRHMADMDYAQYIDCGDGRKRTREALTLEHVGLIKGVVNLIPYADYTYCLIYTGFRPNEMLSLRVDAYDAASGALVGGSKTEAGIDRPITVSPKIRPIIERLIQTGGEFIFPRPDGGMMRDDYFRENCFYPLLERLGIQATPIKGERAKYTPYSCRHTFANLLKNAIGSDTDKAALMGHSSPDMTKYYQSADLASLRSITDQL